MRIKRSLKIVLPRYNCGELLEGVSNCVFNLIVRCHLYPRVIPVDSE